MRAAAFTAWLLVCGACAESVPARDPSVPQFDANDPGDPLLPHASIALTGAQRGALAQLIDDAEASETTSLVVLRRGKTIVDVERTGTVDRLFPLYSITKMFVAMAIGHLVADGRLKLTAKMSEFFPEWAEGDRAAVTVEQILHHTSGLPHVESAKELTAAPDALAYARARQLVTVPGSVFAYSNEGAELLAGVVRIASGEPVDAFVEERILRPLGIARHRWYHDKSGAAVAYGGLQLRARDLARAGQMLLQGGIWQDARVLPEGWVSRMVDPSVPRNVNARYGLLTEVFRDPRSTRTTATIAFGHSGTGYQYLFIAPRSEIVVVRFRDNRGDDTVPFQKHLVRVAEVFEAK